MKVTDGEITVDPEQERIYIRTSGHLTSEQLARLRRVWAEAQQAGRVVVLEYGMTIERIVPPKVWLAWGGIF